MGGINLIDHLLEAYHPTICGKKWCWPLFVNLLNTTAVAAWKIHCQIGEKKITNIDFRRQVMLCLLKVQQHCEIESSVAAELPLDVHFYGVNHFLGPAMTQGQCKVCKKNTRSIYVHKMQHSAWQDLFQNLSYSLLMHKLK